jgi:hypothetical protein
LIQEAHIKSFYRLKREQNEVTLSLSIDSLATKKRVPQNIFEKRIKVVLGQWGTDRLSSPLVQDILIETGDSVR